jgi:general secretion pathway protein E
MSDGYLLLTSGKVTRKVALGTGPFTIGRNFTNLLALEESMASRFHCVIEPSASGLVLRDLGSRNGTRLNGTLIKTARLRFGDTIIIGDTQLKYVQGSPTGGSGDSQTPATGDSRAGQKTAAAATNGDDPPDLNVLEEPPSDSPKLSRPVRTRTGGVKEANGGLAPTPPDEIAVDFVLGDPGADLMDDGGGLDFEAAASLPEYPPEDWERSLRDRVASLPNKAFNDNDIALLNARGKVATPAQTAAKAADTSEAVLLLRLILLACFRSRASDIHVEPKNDVGQVRIRVDGSMVDLVKMSSELMIKLASVVKVLSDIDIAQRNVVQEGHFSAVVPDHGASGGRRRVDYRVSFAPSLFGQKLVVRILDTGNAPLHITDLQQPPMVVEVLSKTILQEAGMILTCGPTGSGKTTTLYALLRDINTTERNVVTIEDPVEIQLEGVTQIPVSESQGNSYSALLKSVLRQDPDVILVGEIRDADTGRVAAQAAMTGHLVFSTVHSRDTVGAIYRLLDLGVEPFLLGSSLHTIVAQRLVRNLCPKCKKSVPIKPEQARAIEKSGITAPQRLFEPRGCQLCLHTGFSGRRGVFELLVIGQELKEVFTKTPSMSDIIERLNQDNFMSMHRNGYYLAAEGITNFTEIERAVG